MKREDIYNAIGELPTTQIRVLVTTGLAVATAAKYFSNNIWVPDTGWLMFLAGMAGLDVAQWTAKRVTYKPEYEDIESDENVTNTTDIQEQYKNQLG